jgi:hypothetical protein
MLTRQISLHVIMSLRAYHKVMYENLPIAMMHHSALVISKNGVLSVR